MLHARGSALPGAALAVVLAAASASAQPAAPTSGAPEPAAPAAPDSATAVEVEPVPVLNVPAMPAADADFSADRELFGETVTDAERARKDEIAQGSRPANDARPLYERWPRLAILTQSVGGVFGAATIGLLGGSIGQAIDPGDKRFALGGAHGPLFGALAGTMAGAMGGVWGSGLLFDKDPGLGWTALGTGVGTVVGAGAAAGFALGLDKGDTATTLAVGSFLACQVGGTVIFNTLFVKKPGAAGKDRGAAPGGRGPIQPPRTPTGPESDDPEMWIFPLSLGRF